MKMKKCLKIFLSIGLMFALTGCNDFINDTEGHDDAVKKIDRDAATNANTEETEKNDTIKFPLTIKNDTGIVIYELYASQSGNSDWEEDILDDDVLYIEESVVVNFEITAEDLVWDFLIVDENDNSLAFYDIDFSNCDVNGGTLTLTYDGVNAYTNLE